MLRKKIKLAIISLCLFLSSCVSTVPVIASGATFKDDACSGLSQLNGGSSCNKGASKSLDGLIKAIINILSIVVGLAAVVMIIVGGLKFITSNGDSNAVASARSSIMYAVIGLIIVAIAQVLVHFVLRTPGKGLSGR